MCGSRVELKEAIEWAQTAQLCAILVNVNRDPKKGKPATSDMFNPVVQSKKPKVERMKVPITVLKRFAHGGS